MQPPPKLKIKIAIPFLSIYLEEMKAKIDKGAYIKLKSFGTPNRVKKQLIKWREICANHVSDKGLISRIYKNSYNSTATPKSNWLKIGGRSE